MPGIGIRITDICNMRCPWCIVDPIIKKRGVIALWTPFAQRTFYEYVVQNQQKLTHIDILGGEPFLFPDEVFKTVNGIRDIMPDVPITVFTNGSCFTPDIISQLNAKHIGACMSFSLNGYKSIEHVERISKYPLSIIKDIRIKSINNVIRVTDKFADDIITLHDMFNCKIVLSPDYTALNELKDIGAFHNFKNELFKLEGCAWLDVNLFGSAFCDCEERSCAFHPNGELINTGCLLTKSKGYGCGTLERIIGKKLHNSYCVVVESVIGGRNERNLHCYN